MDANVGGAYCGAESDVDMDTKSKGETSGRDTLLGVLFWIGVLAWWDPFDFRSDIVRWWSPDAMFGEKLDYYDKTLWKESRPGWRCENRYADIKKGSHGEIIIQMMPNKKSEMFDRYVAHLLPVSHKTFHITASKTFLSGQFAECEEHYQRVKEMLTLKYGRPIYDKEASAMFKFGKTKIGLVYTDLSGEPMVYVDNYIQRLAEKDLIEEYKILQAPTLDAL